MKHILLIVIIIISFLGCKKPGDNFTSRISFLNASLGAAPFRVNLNSDTAVTNLVFGGLKPYRTVPSGTFQVHFFSGPGAVPLLSFLTNFESQRDYTCFIYDSATKGKLFFQKDVLPEAVTDGKCALRFFSLIPGSSGLSLQNDTGRIFLNSQVFNNYSNAFHELDTTSRNIKIVMAGTPALTLDSISRPLVSGKVYTIFLTGSIGGTGLEKPAMVFQEHN